MEGSDLDIIAALQRGKVSKSADIFGRDQEARDQARPDERPVLVSREEPEKWRSFADRLTAEEVARSLQSAERGDMQAQMTLFQEMEERDASLGAVAFTRKAAPVGLERVVMPAKRTLQSEKTRAEAIAAECEEMIENISGFDEWLIDLFDATGKSISVSEIMYRADGSIERFRWVDTSLLEFDSDSIGPRRGKLFVWDREDAASMARRVYIEDHPNKFVVHRSKVRSGHPARGGVLRTIVWAYVFRNYGLRDWSVFCEIFGMPIRLGKYGPTATPADKANLATMLQKLSSDAWAIISEKTSIEFVESINRGTEPFSAFYKALQNEYALAWVGQEATNIVNAFGTKGDSQVKQLVRQDILELDCRQAESTIKSDALFSFVMFRHGFDVAQQYTPKLHFRYEPRQDFAAMANVDKIVLKDLGLGRRVTLQQVAEKYNWELQDIDTIEPEDLVTNPNAAPPMAGDPNAQDPNADPNSPNAPAEPGQSRDQKDVASLKSFAAEIFGKRFAAKSKESPDQRRVDDYVDRLTSRANDALASLPAAVRALATQADDLEDLKARLAKAYDDLEASKFEELLARALFAARLYGRATVADQQNR